MKSPEDLQEVTRELNVICSTCPGNPRWGLLIDAWLPVWLAWSMSRGDDDATQQLLSFVRRFEDRYV
jgi:hypothetical protein